MKADGTTPTQADTAVDAFICAEIEANFPDDLIISEELNHSHRKEYADVWVIDPQDGSALFPLYGLRGLLPTALPSAGSR